MANDKIKVQGPQYRAERITAHHLNAVQFFLKAGTDFHQLPLVNISLTGVAADISQHEFDIELEQNMSFKLRLPSGEISANLIVRRNSPAVVAGEFIDSDQSIYAQLKGFFAAEISGARLKMTVDEAGQREYTDGFDVRLVYSHDQRQITAFRFEMWGNVIDFSGSQLRQGHYIDYEPESKLEPHLLVYSKEHVPELIQFADQMLTQIEDLPSEIKQQVSKIISR